MCASTINVSLASETGLNFAITSGNDYEFIIGKTVIVQLDSANLYPTTSNAVELGKSTNRWSNIYSVNAVIVGSDERLKKDITPSNLGLDFVMNLNPVSYKWIVGQNEIEIVDGEEKLVPIPGKRPHYGFIAQEVKEAMGDNDFAGYIYDEESDSYSLRYGEFIAPLTKAIQEQQEIIKSLQLRIETLEKSANVSL